MRLHRMAKKDVKNHKWNSLISYQKLNQYYKIYKNHQGFRIFELPIGDFLRRYIILTWKIGTFDNHINAWNRNGKILSLRNISQQIYFQMALSNYISHFVVYLQSVLTLYDLFFAR